MSDTHKEPSKQNKTNLFLSIIIVLFVSIFGIVVYFDRVNTSEVVYTEFKSIFNQIDEKYKFYHYDKELSNNDYKELLSSTRFKKESGLCDESDCFYIYNYIHISKELKIIIDQYKILDIYKPRIKIYKSLGILSQNTCYDIAKYAYDHKNSVSHISIYGQFLYFDDLKQNEFNTKTKDFCSHDLTGTDYIAVYFI